MAATNRRRRRSARVATGLVALTALVAVAGVGVAALLHLADDPSPLAARCAAVADGTSWYLAPDQAETAALVAATTLRRGLPARAATIGLATGLQESKLRNIDYGDRDSVGIFQQRPSQGWGTVEQIMDPVYATGEFFDALQRVEGYQDLPVTEAAQRVQRSAFPDAYAQHEPRSRAWASALTGWSPAALTCSLREPDGPGDPAAVVARADRDLGVPASALEDGTVVLDATALPGGPAEDARLGWAVAQWAVAVADPLGLTHVQHGDRVWDRAEDAWVPADEPLPAGQVHVVPAGWAGHPPAATG